MKKPLLLLTLAATLGLAACDRDNRTGNTSTDTTAPPTVISPTPGPSSTPGQPGVAGDAGDLGSTGGSGSLGRPPGGTTDASPPRDPNTGLPVTPGMTGSGISGPASSDSGSTGSGTRQ
jgi:hypothetical protein